MPHKRPPSSPPPPPMGEQRGGVIASPDYIDSAYNGPSALAVVISILVLIALAATIIAFIDDGTPANVVLTDGSTLCITRYRVSGNALYARSADGRRIVMPLRRVSSIREGLQAERSATL